MIVTLSAREIDVLLRAIASAIENEETSMDSFVCSWSKKRDSQGQPYKIVPKEWRPTVRRSKALIAAMNRVRDKLNGNGSPNGHKNGKGRKVVA